MQPTAFSKCRYASQQKRDVFVKCCGNLFLSATRSNRKVRGLSKQKPRKFWNPDASHDHCYPHYHRQTLSLVCTVTVMKNKERLFEGDTFSRPHRRRPPHRACGEPYGPSSVDLLASILQKVFIVLRTFFLISAEVSFFFFSVACFRSAKGYQNGVLGKSYSNLVAHGVEL